MTKSQLCFFLVSALLVLLTPVVHAEWQFRGEPNDWGETPMQRTAEDSWQIIQTFGEAEDEFKIAHQDGWSRSFPTFNQVVTPNKTYLITFRPSLHSIELRVHQPMTWMFRGTPNGWQETPMQVQGQGLHRTCQHFGDGDAVAGARFKVASAEQGWARAFPEQDLPVPAQASIEIVFNELTRHISTEIVERCETDHTATVEINKDALILHHREILSANIDLSFRRFLQQLVDQSIEEGLSPLTLFRQFWDVQNTPSGISVGPNCGDETLLDGVTPALNGFPYICNRREGGLVRQSDAAVETEINSYFPIAAVNRFDLHDKDFMDCGEARMIFARSNLRGFGRNFIIAEAQLPNPRLGEPEGCLPLQKAWLNMMSLDFDSKAEQLEALYFSGIDGFAPVFSIEHFAEDAGQIRTNQFVTTQWVLREHKLVHDCAGMACTLRGHAVTTKENPFGALFNGSVSESSSEFSERAGRFQSQFIERLDSLTTHAVADLSIKTDDEFNNGQSHASGPILENQFLSHFQFGQNSDFFFSLNDAVAGKVDALGTPLSAQQVLNRSVALTCGGCHQPSAFGLTVPNAIGALTLPNGTTINSWPRSNDFVHVNEFADRNGIFTLSPALLDVFLPIRQAKLAAYVSGF